MNKNTQNAPARRPVSYDEFMRAHALKLIDEISGAVPAEYGLMIDERAVQFPYILMTPFGDWVRFDDPADALISAYRSDDIELSGAAEDAVSIWNEFVEMDDDEHAENEKYLIENGCLYL